VKSLPLLSGGKTEPMRIYGLERWLYRLSQSPHRDRFILKGAMLFTLWSEEPHRKTRDLDLLGFGVKNIPEAVYTRFHSLLYSVLSLKARA
jgi:hypothetical protein